MTDDLLTQISGHLQAIRIILALVLGALLANCFWRR